MFNEELSKIASQAKEKLRSQMESSQPKEQTHDLYAEFRDESEVGAEQSSYESAGEVEKLRPYPSSGELQPNPTIPSNSFEDEGLESLAAYDVAIYEGGPNVSQVELWKKEWANHDVFAVEILGESFVVRTLNRFEYKQLVAMANVNALQREEIICETCVFHPFNYDFKAMALSKAGIVSTLSQVIMENSGFTKEYAIQLL